MGMSRKVYETVGGYKITRLGEDIELAIRIVRAGFRTGLIEDAYVYHKRRTDFRRFFRQLTYFGKARINIHSFFPSEIKAVHYFPALFLIYSLAVPLSLLVHLRVFQVMAAVLILYFLAIFADATIRNRSLRIGSLSIVAAACQLYGYGAGFIREYLRRIILKKGQNIDYYPG